MTSSEDKNTQANPLTSRQKSIIKILTQFTVGKPITVSAISETLSLSSRTVLREMPHIEKWLTDNDFKFVRKPGVGLVIDEDAVRSKKIISLLENENAKKELTKKERRTLILSELLQSTEPIKSYVFVSDFKISEAALNTDLEYLSSWLSNYGLNLVKRQGLGIYLDGNEIGFRQAISHAIFEFAKEENIVHILKNDDTELQDTDYKNSLLGLIDYDIFSTVVQILIKTQSAFDIKYTDNAYMFLSVQISLAIQRIKSLYFAEIDREKLISFRGYDEFYIAEFVTMEIEINFDLKLSENEVALITMYFLSQNIGIRASKDKLDYKNINTHMLVVTLVSEVEKLLKIDFRDDKLLIEDLCNHVEAVISRLTVGVRIKNYQIKLIRQSYPEVFAACEAACEILKPITSESEIPEAEIAFFAMHFCAALERKISATKKISVAVVCPTGISTSRILVASIKKEFTEIVIKSTLSALNLDAQMLESENIDLIISTVELKIDFPYVCVNPILLEQDKILIRNKIKNIDIHNENRRPTKTPKKDFSLKNEISEITDLGNGIFDILDNFDIKIVQKVHSKSEILKLASDFFSKNETQSHGIFASLEKRENLGETYISDFNVLFLHCKTEFIDTCRFGYLRFTEPFIENEKQIDGAVIMLLSQVNKQVHSEILSHLSGAFIESPSFFDAIKCKNISEVLSKLDTSLGRFYKLSILKRVEW